MFKNSKNGSTLNGKASTNANPGGGVNTIDAQTQIVGNIKAKGNIRIDGTLEGNLECGGLLVVGPSGSIMGDATCQKAIIEGSFEGNLLVKEELTLEAAARVLGDVKAQKLAVLGGARVKGTCTVPYAGSSNGQTSKAHKETANASA